ncbi:type I DNA topoisomerase [Candidatus Dependentiae bacterium]|nr:type I DNA topoisomerase [Candidatus Dependentiae bacterium]
MKKLLIVESPAKIKTISKFLDKDFKIMSTIGHIKDLPTNTIGVSMNDEITIKYVTLKDKDKVIKDIVKSAKGMNAIYLAPDPDREGEIIAWHVEQEVNKIVPQENIHRITFNEITKPAILNAIAHPEQVDMKKVAAQQARRILDRWVGYEVSPILWRKLAKGLSAGRVQSVALKIICERELEIRKFKPEEYWSVDGQFQHKNDSFLATLTHIDKKTIHLTNEIDTNKIVADIQKQSFIIDSIVDKKRIKNPYAPFITSTLQQAAANQLGFAVKKTMSIAQNMYEGVPLGDPKSPQALITYMRTDSTRLSDTAIEQARNFISAEYGKDYLPATAQLYSKKDAAQDAHEAIRPIDITITPESIKPSVSADIFKLYQLIWARSVATQMKPAIYAQRQITLQAGKYTFKATGSTLIFDGFLKAYTDDSDDEETTKNPPLPKDLQEKENIDLKKITPKQHFTQAPARFSEASLVKELEKQGIGRPSTYATILSTIQTRKYVSLEKKRFTPTDLGMKLTEILDQNFSKIMNIKFTAHMEDDLDKIAQGTLQRDTLLKEFWASFEKDLDAFRGKDEQGKKKTLEQTDIDCPSCKKNKLAVRLGKSGSFIGCLGFPECTFTSNFKRNEDGSIQLIEIEQPTLLEEKCPQCSSQLRKLKGRYGEFISCSGYPKCKFIKQNIAHFACPLCSGKIVERKWKGGTFWGCENYPKCKFSIFSDIEQIPCTKCNQSVYLLKKVDKTGKTTLICPNEQCKNVITKT